MLLLEPVDRIKWDAKNILIAFLLAMLTGTLYFWATAPADRAECYKDAVRRTLRDPGSAVFEGVTVFSDGASGRVNAKNGFGGYTGFRDFQVVGGCGGQITIFPTLQEMEASWR